MITTTKGDILKTGFTGPGATVVVTVNTVGVMGAGLAKMAAQAFPDLERAYRAALKSGLLEIGSVFVVRDKYDHRWALFPTKTDWRKPSKLEYIQAGLPALVQAISDMREEGYPTPSVAIPKLGCGLGDLDWADVKPLILEACRSIPEETQVLIYE